MKSQSTNLKVDKKQNQNLDNLISEALSLHQQGKYLEAELVYEEILEKQPNNFSALQLMGAMFTQTKNYLRAVQCLSKAIKLNPNFAPCYNNMGVIFIELSLLKEAVESFDTAIKLKPNYEDAHINRANALHLLNQTQEANKAFLLLKKNNPKIEWIDGNILYSNMKMCSWIDFDLQVSIIQEKINKKLKVCMPFMGLAIFDSLDIQMKMAQVAFNPNNSKTKKTYQFNPIKKIKIAYISSDFNKGHPVSYLLRGLFKIHDRKKFVVYGVSLQNAGDDDPVRKEIIASFDHFLDVGHLSDLDISNLIKHEGIDIIIDLNGHTRGARQGIFSYEAAPIQVNYLGYAGTTGSPNYSYVITDPVTTPKEFQEFFTEQFAYLDFILPRANSIKKSQKVFSRVELGLPNDGFIFCNFNGPFKITPSVFKIWLNILCRVENSILWLSIADAAAQKNLFEFAEKHGVNRDRLIFATRMDSVEDHLARIAIADLFLDTFPYNAHTTASDAIFTGLPVLTCIGNSFVSRVSGSMLQKLGISELVTHCFKEYEERAVEIALNPELYQSIRTKIIDNIPSSRIFDTDFYVQNIESLYKQMYERYISGKKPTLLKSSFMSREFR